MKLIDRNFIGLISVMAVFVLTSCSAVKDLRENNSGWRPSKFSPASGTLLIVVGENWSPKDEKKIKRCLKNKYPYKYEFIPRATVYSASEYQDMTEYRFALLPTFEMIFVPSTFDEYEYHALTFYDREMKYTYPKTLGGTFPVISFRSVVKACIIGMDS